MVIKMKQTFSHYGITIIKHDDKYFIEYDSGDIVSVIKKLEITKQEADDLQELKDEKSIYEYMIKNLGDRI